MRGWTKEPWPVPDVASFIWAREYEQLNAGSLSLADYIRAKSCVDACVGIPDPAAEIARLRSAVAELSHESVTFQGQRDELAAIVREFEAYAWDGDPLRRESDPLCIRACVALASAEGKS